MTTDTSKPLDMLRQKEKTKIANIRTDIYFKTIKRTIK